MIAVGLMSGTSFDGVDAALVRITPRGTRYDVETLGFVHQPYAPEVQAQLTAALPPNTGSVELVARLHRSIGQSFARAARAVIANAQVDYVASHGQTVWHDGDRHVTMQLGDPFVIREAVDVTVVADFRLADTAAGGCGAPLVPYVDAILLQDDRESRVALNIGGIANITVLPAGQGSIASAFDTGPGNMLIDAFVNQRTNREQRFDRDGELAGRGVVNEGLLTEMLREPYFMRTPPKSTGRELFGAQFLARYDFGALSLADGATTLTEFTAATIADAIAAHARPQRQRVIVSGGGARNPVLLTRLQARLPSARVETSAVMGIDPDAKEAIAFAVLGYETLRGRAANVPSVTGAVHPAVLGAIAPRDLTRLLVKVEAECA